MASPHKARLSAPMQLRRSFLLPQVVMAVFAYLYFNNVVARQTVTVGYVLQKSLQLDGPHMLELFTKLGASCSCLSCHPGPELTCAVPAAMLVLAGLDEAAGPCGHAEVPLAAHQCLNSWCRARLRDLSVLRAGIKIPRH